MAISTKKWRYRPTFNNPQTLSFCGLTQGSHPSAWHGLSATGLSIWSGAFVDSRPIPAARRATRRRFVRSGLAGEPRVIRPVAIGPQPGWGTARSLWSTAIDGGFDRRSAVVVPVLTESTPDIGLPESGYPPEFRGSRAIAWRCQSTLCSKSSGRSTVRPSKPAFVTPIADNFFPRNGRPRGGFGRELILSAFGRRQVAFGFHRARRPPPLVSGRSNSASNLSRGSPETAPIRITTSLLVPAFELMVPLPDRRRPGTVAPSPKTTSEQQHLSNPRHADSACSLGQMHNECRKRRTVGRLAAGS